jgi:diphthine methyl ester acylhydrolase
MDASSKFSQSVTPLWSGILDAPPSCVEFVSRSHNPGFEYFIVGTYTLLASGDQSSEVGQDDAPDQQAQQPTKPQEKIGGLKLFRIDHGKV